MWRLRYAVALFIPYWDADRDGHVYGRALTTRERSQFYARMHTGRAVWSGCTLSTDRAANERHGHTTAWD